MMHCRAAMMRDDHLPPPSVVIAVGGGARGAVDEVDKGEKRGEVVIELINVEGGGDWGSEDTCRVCHMSREVGGSRSSELIRIGCECRGELAVAHRDCGEAWFRVKGNRYCEICNMNAKNIVGEDDDGFMEEWHEGRPSHDDYNRNLDEQRSCRGRPLCKFLLGCVILAFVLPWFLHIKII